MIFLLKNIIINYFGIVLLSVFIIAKSNTPDNLATDKKFVISGYIKDSNGEELIGATVYIKGTNIGTVTNQYGFYSISLPEGEYIINFSFVGYTNYETKINLNANKKLNVFLNENINQLEEVEIFAKSKKENIERVEMSTVNVPMKIVEKLPSFLGEVDILKTIQMLPGVQSGTEGTTGYYVRGGTVDQNLVLLDGANVYNPSHIIGIFSIFNGDAIKNIDLFTGGIPAQYGGRLSSVLDVRMKEGSTEKFKGSGGIGLISSRLSIEGPIYKNKSSIFVSGRRSYYDLFFPLSKKQSIKNSSLYFYDFNAKANYIINENNRIFISGYFGRDVFKFDTLFSFNYGNATVTGRWNHVFNDKIFMNLTLIYSDYQYGLGSPSKLFPFEWKASITDYSINNDYTWYILPNSTLSFGIQSTFHDFMPGKAERLDTGLLKIPKLPDVYALEHGIYIQQEQKLSDIISIQAGLRLSIFQNIGKATIYHFKDYVPYDSSVYKNGEIFNTYYGFEPRIGVRFKINSTNSIKASYNRIYQYIHLASITSSVTPVDFWFPSNPNIAPQIADQIALGYFLNLLSDKIELSFETYYKKMNNVVDFKEYANIFLNPYFDAEIRRGRSKSYGFEFMAKKNSGKLNGWISYTLSKTTRKIDDINSGKEFLAPYDRTHNLAIILSYDINNRFNISGNWLYSTAIARTVPIAKFRYAGESPPIWSGRNEVRIPGTDYHRLDLSVTFYEKKFKKDGSPRKYFGNWNLSVYNVYARKNPFSITFKVNETNANITEARKIYLFKILPSITYNFNF
jgi:hypothetical protein